MKPSFRRLQCLVPAAAVLLCACGCATVGDSERARRITDLPDLDSPALATDRAYLGLADNASRFTLADIQAEIIVVDLFDMYCHVCQTAARHVRELERETHESGRGEQFRFIGLGVGNTPLEAQTYRKKFDLPFPVFPDREAVVTRSLGSMKVPSLIVLRRRDGILELIHRTTGVVREQDEFLEHILHDAGHIAPGDADDELHNNGSTCEDGKPECGSDT